MPVVMIHVPVLVVLVSVIVGHREPKDHFHAEGVSLEVRIMILWFRLVRRVVGGLRVAVLGVEAEDLLEGAAVDGHGVPDGLLVRRVHVHHVDGRVHVVHGPVVVRPVVAVAVSVSQVQRGRLLGCMVGVVVLVGLVVDGGVVAVCGGAMGHVRVVGVDGHVVAVVVRRRCVVWLRVVRRVMRVDQGGGVGHRRQVLRQVVWVGQEVRVVRVVDERGVRVHEVGHVVVEERRRARSVVRRVVRRMVRSVVRVEVVEGGPPAHLVA